MGKFYKWVEKIFTVKTTIFGIEVFYASLVAMTIFSILAIMNTYNFILALIALNFYWALAQLFLFSWNTGFLYYNWLLNRMQMEIAKNKT